MAWNKKYKKKDSELFVLKPEDNFFLKGEIDFQITTQQMVNEFPVNAFNDVYLGDNKKLLNWDMAQSLFHRIKISNPELIEEFDKKYLRQ